MNFKRLLPLAVAIAVLIGIIAVSSKNEPEKSAISVSTADTIKADTSSNKSAEDDTEMRGIWVTYMELSMDNEADKSQQGFTEKFSSIANLCKEKGFNTIIAQVRPFGDALYKSSYYPWSHILSGTQGVNPEYDALQIMCDICHKNNLKIHAWVNPYRVKNSETPSELSDDNPYVKDNSLGFETESGIYLYPSNKSARELIINGIDEIVSNYDIDGIQFDDYFYPADMGNEDKEQYEKYKSSANNDCMSLEEWRKANVNLLITDTYRTIHSKKDNVVFGISPQGNISNNDSLYADVKSWCECRGYVDYICPQIYFSLENPALSFDDALNSWCKLNFADNVKLYVGLAGYKAGTDKDSNTWAESDSILAQEYDKIKQNSKVQGCMLYSYNSLNSDSAMSEIDNLTECFASSTD